MKARFKEIKDYLYDWQEDVQDRLFILLTTIALSGMLIAFVTGICIGESLESNLSVGLGFCFFCPLVYFAYKYRRINLAANIIACVLVFIFFPAIFFSSGGIYGGSPIWFVFGVLYIGMILRGKVRIVLFFAEMFVVILCYYIEYTHPETVIPHDVRAHFSDSIGSLIVVSLILTILMSFQTYVYRRENEITKDQKDEIDVLNKSQNRFFSSMSHEIRTPINTIIGLNEMIIRETDSEEIKEDALNIQAASKILLHLVNDILDMSKLQSGQMQLTEAPYNPKEMILDVVNMLQVQANDKNLEFNVNVAPDIPSGLIGDEVRIRQILINIINNAIKYTEEGYVTLSVQCSRIIDGRVTLTYSVSDTGIGIKKENIDSLFTAFRRMDEERNKNIEGTGLGLSIVKQLVHLMGGDITVNSVYTKGSTFIIELPQTVSDPKPIGQIDSQEKRSRFNIGVYHQSFEAPDARILVVDDTVMNLKVVSKLLKATRVEVDTASGGAEALKMTLKKSYHVIFMDHLMPEMDGIECMHRIRSQTGGLSREAVFVALTANAGIDDMELYQKEGFDSCLIKPVTGSAIENELHRLLPRDLIKSEAVEQEVAEDSTLWISSRRKKAPVKISTTSVADIPEEFIRKYNIAILPLTIETEEGLFRDSVDIDTDGLIDYMEGEGKEVHMKELESDAYESFFAEQLQYANNIIHVSVSSKVQANSYISAVEAARTFDNVHVVDTGQISTGQGLIAMEAGRMASEGMAKDEILARIEELKKEVITSFIVDSMDRLASTGKVSPLVAGFTKAFMIRSVLCFKNGKIAISRVYFGSRDHAWERYISYALKDTRNIDRRELFITHVGLTRKDLMKIREEVESKVVFDNVYFQKASPALATSTGPGTFGLLFWRLPDIKNKI